MDTLSEYIAGIKSDTAEAYDELEALGATLPAAIERGTYQLKATIQSVPRPKLHAPSISRSNDTISISNPSTNGSYLREYAIYNGNSLRGTTTLNSFTLTGLGAGTYELSIKARGDYFEDSDKSNVIKASVYTITRTLENLTASNSTALMANGMPYTVTLTPASGYYLPEDIVVTMGGKSAKYTYDSYTGVINIPSVNGNVVIEAVAYNAAKLRRPVISLSDGVLSVTPPRYAESTKIYIDNNLEYTYNDDRTATVEKPSDVTYGFTLGEDGYYKSDNAGVNSSYAYAKVLIDATYDCHIALECINYGYSSSNFGIVSKLDTDLAKSTSTDGSSLYERSFSNQHSNNVVSVEFDVPTGEHYITVKYKKTNSTTGSGFDGLKFKVNMM